MITLLAFFIWMAAIAHEVLPWYLWLILALELFFFHPIRATINGWFIRRLD